MRHSALIAAGLAILATPIASKPLAHHRLHRKQHQIEKRYVTAITTVTDDITVTLDVWVTAGNGVPVLAPTQPKEQAHYVQPANQPDAAATPGSEAAAAAAAAASPNVPPTSPPAQVATTPLPTTTPAAGAGAGAGSGDANAAQAAINSAQAASNSAHQASMQALQASIDAAQAASNAAAAATPATTTAAAAAAASPAFVPQIQAHYAQPQGNSPAASPTPSPTPNSSSGSSSSSAPSGGSCGSVGGKCVASDVTTYDSGTSGMGACGWVNNDKSPHYLALAGGQFGSFTNDNPGNHKNAWCGRTVTIQGTGGPVNAVLTDKCPECQGWSLDLSPSLWSAVFPGQSPSRNHDITWWFTSEATYSGAA